MFRTFLIGLVTALGVGVSSGLYAWHYVAVQLDAIRAELPAVDEPGTWRPALKTRICAADGTLLTEIYRENRELVPLTAIPRRLIDATIATEDRRFREHVGFSPRDIVRATVANVQAGRTVQGASTITQQLVRDLYLSRKKQVRRKIAEALLAVEMEKRYAKDEILELYLNQVNYGKGLYGVRTAAGTYFGKAPEQLTLGECAALAAVPQRPTDFHLYTDHAGAVRRRDGVLGEMCELGFITTAQRDAARREALHVRPYEPPNWTPRRAPYYTSWAVREAMSVLGEERVYAGGLTVTCHLDLSLQATADEAVARAVAQTRAQGASQGAAVLLDPHSGAVLALVGGLDWSSSQFNRATQARRQPGSAFKLFVYTAAVDRGYRPTDRILDAPVEIPDGLRDKWRPTNYDQRWHGEVTLQHALALSINIPAVKLLQRLGPEVVAGYAQRMGIRSPLRTVPSLALGTSEVTLLELVSAYGVLPAGGARVEPTTISRVEDLNGRVVYQSDPQPVAVLTPPTVVTMTQMLRAVMVSGTGRPAQLEAPCGGKTGTTQDGRDAWFIGFTPNYVAGVWLGNDRYRPMHGVYGGSECGPAWRRIMAAAIRRRGGAGEFSFPRWLEPNDPRNSRSLGYQVEITGQTERSEVTVCTVSGARATPHCPTTAVRTFEPGQEPAETCPLHRAPPPRPAPPPRGATGEPVATTDPEILRPDAPASPLGTTPEVPAGDDLSPAKRTPVAEPAVPLERQYVICPVSGLLAKPGCPDKEVREHDPGAAPTRECDLH